VTLAASSQSRRIEPEFLGPLLDRPLPELAKQGHPDDLFPGASVFLSARHQRRRREQWDAARPLAEKLLEPGEHILYVAYATEIPGVLTALALGHMAMAYHQVALVFTEERLIEVLLTWRAKSASTRVRSFPWMSVSSLTLGLGKLKMASATGRRKIAWRIPVRGDRKLLTPLLERLKPRLLMEGAGRATSVPFWHCPQCGGVVPENPEACPKCRTTFKSKKIASLLALAFPGAGLFYAGHPWLAVSDFLGEAFLYCVFLMLLLQADSPGTVAAIGLGALLFAVTKFHSVRLSRILVARTRPETEAQRRSFTRFAIIGGLASLALIGGPLPLAGAARPVVDRDLDIAGQESAWHGSRVASEWGVFAGDPTARSQWRNPQGLTITLFAYPQSALDSPEEFRRQFRETLARQGATIIEDDQDLPAPFKGFRFVGVTTRKDGTRIALMHYFVVDSEHHDLHQVLAASLEQEAGPVETMLRDFLSHARFIAAKAPDRTAAPAPASTSETKTG
jgi:hypothetical protein